MKTRRTADRNANLLGGNGAHYSGQEHFCQIHTHDIFQALPIQ